MSIFDNQLWINNIDEFGESVTVRTITDSSYSKWGDATESASDEASVKAIVEDFNPEESKETEGIFPNVTKRFFFKPDQSNITEGNRIVHNSVVHEIVRVLTREMAGSDFIIEVWGEKL
ncbi:hypothetical protein LCGC14_1335940 [marine sediment metagenome]|uniref:Phage protein n=1 Tax=marine sediment metagenome TaxID=412755 RepID=A0A0F9KFW7_9ZZZZ